MNKLYKYIPCFLLVCTFIFLSCEKLRIPDYENSTNIGKVDDTDNDNSGEGDDILAYSVSDIINGRFTETKDVYVVGYIVGYVRTSNMDFCVFSRGDVDTNIIIADTPIDTFANKCIPVQLTTITIPCKETRIALNLAKNDVLGQKVRLQGDIDNYMGTDFGLIKARNHTFLENDFDESVNRGDNVDEDERTDEGDGDGGDGMPDSPEEDGNPDIPDDGEGDTDDDSTQGEQQWEDLVRYIYSHGTEDAPFTITDFKTSLPEYLNHYGAPEIGSAGMKDVYICGYIVGYIPKGNRKIEKAVFGNDGTTQTNIIMADSPDEQDWNNCIAIELSLSSNRSRVVREALNLADNPDNYKKRFIIYGNIETYMGTLGLKSVREYLPYNEK